MLLDYFFSQEPTPESFVPKEQTGPSESTGLLASTRNRISEPQATDSRDWVVETPDLISLRQAQLEQELQAIAVKPAFNYVQRTSPHYLEGLLLMFLRAERFDASKTAPRLVSFFEAKLQLFGAPALGRSLVLADLSVQDQICLRSGCLQLLSSRSASKQAILCYFPKYHIGGVESLVRYSKHILH